MQNEQPHPDRTQPDDDLAVGGARLAELLDLTRAWISADPEAATRNALAAMVERAERSGDTTELEEHMGRRLEFGTAGLRGAMGPGSNRLNRLVVRQTAAGLADAIRSHGDPVAGVLVGHDARHHSAEFARDIVSVLEGAGVACTLVDGPNPTPLIAWGMRRLGATAAVVVTASHNPAQDNGIKIYWSDGAQIIPPVDRWIAEAIDAAATLGDPDAPAVQPTLASPELTDDYVAFVASLVGPAPRPPADSARTGNRGRTLRIAATSMHGVGDVLLRRCLAAAGFSDLHVVAGQSRPDPDFPTVAFPNPEEPGATDALLALAESVGADVAFANDPDADRLAVGVAGPDGWRMLSGDDVGALFAVGLLDRHPPAAGAPLLVTTVVSSQLLAEIAGAVGATFRETLTGFKWLCRPALEDPSLDQVLAYEEALGYAVGGLRDKDGLSAAVVMADLLSTWSAEGTAPRDVLDDLARRHGAHVQDNRSTRVSGPGWVERIAAIAASVTEAPPSALGGVDVGRTDRPAADVLRWFLDNGDRVVIRPSGTEPKLKVYAEAVEPVRADEPPDAARSRARARLELIHAELSPRLRPAP